MFATSPRSVYLHVPFCRHRCGYCNFSVVAGRDYLIQRYLNAVEREIAWLDQKYEIDTLFFGGGTPSHLQPQQLRRLMDSVRSRFRLSDGFEFTAECNPNDLTPATADALQAIGVNRVSLGVQSLNIRKLKLLEREHSADDVARAVRLSQPFASVSIDLIFATPGESLADWQSDLDSALQLQPDHVSAYELTYEKGTRFWSRHVDRKTSHDNEDLRADMYSHAIDRFAVAGMPQYEVSSFASNEHRCRHNEVYWSGDPYLAFGPGASRFVDGVRETNHSSTMFWLKQIELGVNPIAERVQLSPEDAARERLAIGLRHVDGVAGQHFVSATGFEIADLLGEHFAMLQQHNLLVHDSDDGAWKLTRAGRMVYDQIATKIVAENL